MKTLVLLSGGQDSVTCLHLVAQRAARTGRPVEAIGFAYGQRHVAEMERAAFHASELKIPFTPLQLPTLMEAGVSSALLRRDKDITKKHDVQTDLPASFVPGRNALFLTIAHAHAQAIGAEVVVTGVCQTDFSGYPDCRHQFVLALQAALNLGYRTDIRFVTPLMYLDKAETFGLATALFRLNTIIGDTLTCYNGVQEMNAWGRGCGQCPACDVRRAGYTRFLARQQSMTPGEFELWTASCLDRASVMF